MLDPLCVYSMDNPIEIDGRATTLRKEWGASNAHLWRELCREEAISWHVTVHRLGRDSVDFRVSQEVYESIESGRAWA